MILKIWFVRAALDVLKPSSNIEEYGIKLADKHRRKRSPTIRNGK
jgi:hypothetical protein